MLRISELFCYIFTYQIRGSTTEMALFWGDTSAVTTTFLLTHCAKLPSLRKHVSKSYRNLDEATEILTPHAPLFSRVHIEKNCAIYYSSLLFESTFPKFLWINHKVLVQQDIYLEKPFPMMWMYFFFNTDFVIVQHASKLFNWTSFLTWGKNFVKSYKFLLLFKNVLEQKMIWLLEKKCLTLDYTLWNFRRKKWWVQSILKLFWKDYHDVINEGLKVHLSLILITGVKTNKPAY